MSTVPNFSITDENEEVDLSFGDDDLYGVNGATVELSPSEAMTMFEIMNEVSDREGITGISVNIGVLDITSDNDEREFMAPSWVNSDTKICGESICLASFERHNGFTVECTINRPAIEDYLVENNLIPATDRRSEPAPIETPTAPRP